VSSVICRLAFTVKAEGQYRSISFPLVVWYLYFCAHLFVVPPEETSRITLIGAPILLSDKGFHLRIQ
jgi:hypothetical protein